MNRKIAGVGVGFLYFYVHFVTEILCFFVLSRYVGTNTDFWAYYLFFDMLAFVPQGVIGYVSDRFPKIPFGAVGFALMAAAIFIQTAVPNPYVSLAVLCIGNACTHIDGAEATLRTSRGSLTPSAIFVSGGAFGILTGHLISMDPLPWWVFVLLAASAVPFTILGEMCRRDSDRKSPVPCAPFDLAKKTAAPVGAIIAMVFIIATRGYMAYGIPMSWKNTVWETIAILAVMGVGKALGGVFADLFDARKVAVISAAAALPFLLFGNKLVAVSLFGVMLFSMTMSITLAALVSVLKKRPGLAFGLTTIGLFIGTAPVFFFKFTSFAANCIMISVLTAVCILLTLAVMRKDGDPNE